MRDGCPWDEPAVTVDALERDWTNGLAGRGATRADTVSGGRSVGVGSVGFGSVGLSTDSLAAARGHADLLVALVLERR